MHGRGRRSGETGAGRGIGRALCREFARRGAASIVVADLDGSLAQSTAAELGGLGLECDVADPQGRLAFAESDLGVGNRLTLLDDELPDIVHAHHLTCLSTGIAAQCAARGIPLVLTLNDYWLMCHRGQLLDLDLARCDGPEAGRCAACAGLAASGQPAVHAAARGLRAIERRLPSFLAAWQRRVVSGASRSVVPESARAEITRRLDHVRSVCDSAARILAPSNTLMERFARFGIPPLHYMVLLAGGDVRCAAHATKAAKAGGRTQPARSADGFFRHPRPGADRPGSDAGLGGRRRAVRRHDRGLPVRQRRGSDLHRPPRSRRTGDNHRHPPARRRRRAGL